MRCILCKGKVREKTSISHRAGSFQSLPKKPKQSGRYVLSLFECERCGLIQQSNKPPSVDYCAKDYVSTSSHIRPSKKYQRSLAAEFVKRFRLGGKRIIEVSGGDGLFSLMLKRAGADVTMLEPSEAACKIARGRGVKAVNGYLGAGAVRKQAYDAFAMRQVLEHSNDPKKFMSEIRRILKPGAVGLVEVPNAARTFAEGRWLDISPEHVAYYMPHTLARLIRDRGFETLEMRIDAEGEYLLAFVRAAADNHPDIGESAVEDSKALAKLVTSLNAKGGKVAFWGAGARGVAAISACGLSSAVIAFVIDSDRRKWGRYVPGTGIPVVSPTHIKDAGAVIVSSAMYQDDVVGELRRMAFGGAVAVLKPKPRILSGRLGR